MRLLLPHLLERADLGRRAQQRAVHLRRLLAKRVQLLRHLAPPLGQVPQLRRVQRHAPLCLQRRTQRLLVLLLAQPRGARGQHAGQVLRRLERMRRSQRRLQLRQAQRAAVLCGQLRAVLHLLGMRPPVHRGVHLAHAVLHALEPRARVHLLLRRASRARSARRSRRWRRLCRRRVAERHPRLRRLLAERVAQPILGLLHLLLRRRRLAHQVPPAVLLARVRPLRRHVGMRRAPRLRLRGQRHLQLLHRRLHSLPAQRTLRLVAHQWTWQHHRRARRHAPARPCSRARRARRARQRLHRPPQRRGALRLLGGLLLGFRLRRLGRLLLALLALGRCLLALPPQLRLRLARSLLVLRARLPMPARHRLARALRVHDHRMHHRQHPLLHLVCLP
mmetsp:Transcript_20015/g.63740  ORF Transcript_20015/g.63740 Transcript_20015/m.63740 type:complete len:391 (+) Transcript_20015:693-1865(+)